ncbi:MAG: YkvA family protein [Caldiserica bacterium]|nr:YkvA family protein [Caldisericota bacterium]
MNIENLKNKARRLKNDTFALYFALQDPRVPFFAKTIIIFVVGYALSPIDLIPDFIPVLGYLDDLIIVPLGIALALKMIPKEILVECREKVKNGTLNTKIKWIGAIIVISIWILIIYISIKIIIAHKS